MQDPVSKFRFGSYELDCASGELRKHGLRVKLEDQPFRLLAALVQRHGEVVERDVLKSELWAEDTYVDFDRSLTRAINKVRAALGDTAANPLFLETLPRRGYRFVAPVSLINGEPSPSVESATPAPSPPRTRRRAAAALAILAGCLAIGAAFLFKRGPSPSISSVAVLPFQSVSPDQNYFGDGMTDQLIATLSRSPSLRVVSHKSVVRYRGTQKKLSDIARDLNVDALVDGSVTHDGRRIRVNTRLIRFPGERTAWTKSYERDAVGILSLQAELAQNIAAEIGAATRPAAAVQVDPEVHALYLKGRFLANEVSRPSIELGIRTLNRAVERDPTYAPAYAALAMGWFGMSSIFLKPNEAIPNAKAAARKAVQLDPGSDSAHAALGLINVYYDWDWASADRQFAKALALNPNSADSLRGLACLRLATGQEKLSVEAANQAMLLEPMSLQSNLVSTIVLTFTGRDQDAFRRARAALDWEPEYGLIRSILGMLLLDRGQHDAAIRELERAAQSHKIPPTIALLAYGYARAGRTREAEKLLDDLVATDGRQYLCAFEIAAAYGSLGQLDKAFAWMRRAVDERADCVALLRAEPWLAPLRSDPRYAALLKEVGFPAQVQ